MDERLIMIVLRLFHIIGGIFWVGGILVVAYFLAPAQRDIGEEGGRFLRHVMIQRKLSTWFSSVAGLTILSGGLLYWRLIATSDGAWARTPSAMGFGAGAVAAIIALSVGASMSAASAKRMGQIGQAIAASGGKPTPEQSAEIGRLGARATKGVRIAAALLLFAASAMAVARYL